MAKDIYKKCSKCKKNKLVSEFHRSQNEKDGLHSHCKECKYEYCKKNKSKIKILCKKYYKENEDKLKKKNKIWNENNKDYYKKYYKKNYEKNFEKVRKYYIQNRENILEKSKKWQKENLEKRKQIQKRYYERNLKKCKERNREYEKKNKDKRNLYRKERRNNNLQKRLRDNVSCLINYHLKKRLSSKNHKLTFSFLPYTVEELEQHLEKQFEPWMNWNNWGRGRGRWNIDHFYPDCKFDYKSVEDEEFQECWSLSNLRPMDAIENIRKSDKIIS